MVRRILLLSVICYGLFTTLPAAAQGDQLEQARAELQAGRDEIIRADLRLNDAEFDAFWPVYEDYVGALAPLRDRKAELIARFSSAYRTGEFSDEFAAWLIEENFAIKANWMKVQLEFVPKFRGILPVQKVARFIQLENKLDAEVDAQLALALPLVE